ncbi:WD40 repeat-like protein [Piedraia hortae CBS 480.64]|uniref:WD40 repeat-like protein n=1 Tax=Piedraia hortae CBS 480.64 TaxID=1314780 RepID=A0A6A7BZA1_9PEZI|nr:WD40 repeat-like protein [Piedraia hortae CBS 480.64]
MTLASDDESTRETPRPTTAPGNGLSAQWTDTNASKELRKGGKAVSFLTKLMGSARKKETDEEVVAAEDEEVENRPEGTEAALFAQPLDSLGFSPQHAQPPAYIKVQSRHKKKRDFDRLFLAQELECRQPNSPSIFNGYKLRKKGQVSQQPPTVWAMSFSQDGKYLAAAGSDKIIRIWAVLSSLRDRCDHENQEAMDPSASSHLSAPVFQSNPVREYTGHTSTILDLSWSKNGFLLSSSMDKTVRLWHVHRPECLCTFKHKDFVPSIAFHPKDDRFFLAGSLDCKLRLWSIPDKSVAYSTQLSHMITAVSFTPDGKHSIAGDVTGLCSIFETDGLRYQTSVHARSTRGQNSKGSKITGIRTFVSPLTNETKLLITSNDSRIRQYNFRDKSLELKFKGNVNDSSQIRASISDDSRFLVCGSEDQKAYIWSLPLLENEKRDKRPLELFKAHNSATTAVCLAPAKTKHLLSQSDDPIYDLCSPQPITLLSRSETLSRPATTNGTPPRSTHPDGNIIVTASYSGSIKVFRQDCAFSIRNKILDRPASIFSARRTGSRAGSLATKASVRSLRSMGPPDRALSWRQGLSGLGSRDASPRKRSVDTTASGSRRFWTEMWESDGTGTGGSGSGGSSLRESPPRSRRTSAREGGRPTTMMTMTTTAGAQDASESDDEEFDDAVEHH